MKTYIKMSWRNLWRHKRRSLVVISSITVGTFFMITSMGLMNGVNNQMIENTIKTSLGHISIQKKGFNDYMKLKYSFTPDDPLWKTVENEAGISGCAPRVKLQGMIRSSEASRGVLIVGIDPEREKSVSNIYEYTEKSDESGYLKPTDDNSMLISKSLAKKLNIRSGERVVLMLQDINNEISGTGFIVKGYYVTPIDTFDQYVVFTTINKLQSITNLKSNISEINIALKNSKDVDSVKESLIKKLKTENLDVLSWKDMAPYIVNAVMLFESMTYVLFLIIFLTIIFSVANTLVMAIMERFHEFGVMKCIGTGPIKIFWLIIFESINLGVIGLIAGIITGVITNEILSITGIDYSIALGSVMKKWGTGFVIYHYIKPVDIVIAAIIVFDTVVTAALYPAVKAARIKPLNALHHI